MTWFITYKPLYDTDFIDLSKDLQKRATQVHAELEQDPITPRGNTIKKLTGWENLWRYRIDAYRLIYAANPHSRVVQLLAIGPRKDIYRRFNYDRRRQPVTLQPGLSLTKYSPAAQSNRLDLHPAPQLSQHPGDRHRGRRTVDRQ